MFRISKMDFYNLCKSMGKDPELEKLRAEVLSILKKKAKSENAQDEKSIHKSLEDMDKSFKYFDKDEFIVKSGYPVGTIREWKGKKYIKVAPNKWKPKYDSESKGAKNSITRLMKQVEKCGSVEELMNLVMANKQRFTDANGNHLPIVDKLRVAADKKNEELSSGGNNPDYPFKPKTEKERAERVAFEKDRDAFIERMDKLRESKKDTPKAEEKKDESEAEKVKAEPKKESAKESKPVASAYAPSESTALNSKEIIATNKSVGEGEVEMPYSKELDAEIKGLNANRSTDESRYFLNHVYYSDGNLVATDGRRMKTIKVGELEGIPNGSFVDVTSGKDGVKVKVKKVTDNERNKANFPKYSRVIPEGNTQKVTLDNKVLKDKIKAMLKDGSIDKKSGRVALEFKDDGVFIDGTKVGNASNIKLVSGGCGVAKKDTNNITMNANYLLDALNGNESTMMLSDDAGKPMSIGTGSTNNIIMPMKPMNETDPNILPDYEAGRKAKAEADAIKNEAKKRNYESNKAGYEWETKIANEVSAEEFLKPLAGWTNEQVERLWKLGNISKEYILNARNMLYNNEFKKIGMDNWTALRNHAAMQRPEIRAGVEAEMKKRGLDTSIKKSLFDDFEEDYEGETIEKSVDDLMDFFESASIAETVHSVLSSIR